MLDTSAKMTTRIENKLHLFQKDKPNTRKKNASNKKLPRINNKFIENITGEILKQINDE